MGATTLTQADPEDGRYNARDVLGMCRAYIPLVNELQRVATTQVYEMDRALACIALQMTKVGLPVKLEERERVRGVLQGLATEAADKLLIYTQGEHYDTFANWVCSFQAANARKNEPIGGQVTAAGVTLSDEMALELRKQIRRNDFDAKIAKSALQEAVYQWVQYGTEQGTPYDNHTLAAHLNADVQKIATMMRTWGNRGIFTTEKKIEGKGKDKRTVYTSTIPELETPEAREHHREQLDEVVKGISINSKAQQAAILRTAGVPLLKVTEKTRQPQIDKDSLGELGHHEAARDMLQYILTDKAVSTIDSFDIEPDERYPGYGWIHADWMVHKITGRWGSSPNVQNWSKRAGGGAENLRTMIAAPPGMIIVGADYAQLEARLMAAQSQDPFLMNIFQTGQDIHAEFAKIAFPNIFPQVNDIYLAHREHQKRTGESCATDPTKPYCDHCMERSRLRDLTKRLEYGCLYGGSVETLWQSVVKDVPDLKLITVQQFMAATNQNCKGLREWQANLLRNTIKEGVIRSPILGRCQFFPMGRVDPTVISNFPMQSGGADLWGMGAIAFAEKHDQYKPPEESPRIFHNGHDSVSVLCKEDRADEVMADIEECWGYEWNGIKFFIEPEKSEVWADT